MQRAPLSKPWDFKALAERLKARGLDVAEEGAKILVEEGIVFIEDSVKMSENKMDDLVLVGTPKLKELVLQAVDKIDGQVG